MRTIFILICIVCLATITALNFIRPHSSSELSQEDQARNEFASKVGGKIVFDSNRSGTFGIHVLDPATGTIESLADSELHEMYPDPNPEGTLIVYAQARDLEERRSQIWIMNRDGSEKRLLAKKGTFPTFSADGQTIYFERARRKVMAINLDGTQLRKIFPRKDSDFKGKYIVKPTVSKDGRYVAFTSNKPDYWNAWLAPLDGGKATHISRGCEPSWIPGSDSLVWVKRHGAKEMAGIYTYDPTNHTRAVLEDRHDPFGHEYFPAFSAEKDVLLFAACPGAEHSHSTANYQLFGKAGKSERLRLTHDTHTNRWPKILPDS